LGLSGVESVAVKIVACFVLLSAILAPSLFGQTQTPPAATPPQHLIRISAKVAEKLLLQKVGVCYNPQHAWASRVRGTVVVAIEIDKNGNVLHPKVVSGPFMLQKPVLDAVEKYYKYKPYLLDGRAVDVETTVSVYVGLQCDSPTDYWIG
jgi:outer membrane biosynthesis protein TonB